MTLQATTAWSKFDRSTRETIAARVKAYQGATPARVAELADHQLTRVLLEVCPYELRRLEVFQSSRGHCGGRRLTTYLRHNFLPAVAARRMLPAIDGLRQMGHVALAARCAAEFSDWVHKCAKLGAGCPKTFPARHSPARDQFVNSSVQDLLALLLELAAIAHRAYQGAGFQQYAWPIFGEIYSAIFRLKKR